MTVDINEYHLFAYDLFLHTEIVLKRCELQDLFMISIIIHYQKMLRAPVTGGCIALLFSFLIMFTGHL